jgi:hypothetical protein
VATLGRATRAILFALLALGTSAVSALAQGGPPLFTNDPGTPGAENWEINLGFMPVLTNRSNLFQVPQFDINYGVGDRIQLTYEVSFVAQTAPGQPTATGWDNALPGVKWRFIDQGEKGWNISTFPQIEIQGTKSAINQGLAESGNRFFLPLEVSHPLGPVNLNFEAGYFFPLNSPQSRNERILGLAMGHTISPRFEAIGEVYDDKVMGSGTHDTTFDFGGRYEFHKGLLLLFMAGRSFSGNASGQPEFLAYVGVQILLERNGRALHSDR